MADGGNSKATFTPLDGGGAEFAVQYNPKEFRVEKSVTWQEAQNQGQSSNAIQFQKGAPMGASFDLVFDTTADGANVQQVWVEKLLALTNANVTPAQGEAAELQKMRPPTLNFHWGTFEMKCVIESVNVTYLMFTSEGTAVRARCSVKLKQWEPEDFVGSGESGRFSAAKIKLVEVKGGQTATQVAAAAGTDTRALCEANGITDPMADLTGQTLAVPTAAATASAKSAAASAAKSAASSAAKSAASKALDTAMAMGEKAAKSAASSAANAALDAVLSGNSSAAGRAAQDAAQRNVTGAASTAAKNALKKLF